MVAVFLDEDQIGSDPREICYPHLLFCMGTTVLMSDGTLIGAHVTMHVTENAVLEELRRQIENRAVTRTMRAIYFTGNIAEHFSSGGMSYEAKARALGFTGDAYIFDTGSIRPQDGTFVSVTSLGGSSKAMICYKRDEKVRDLYQIGAGPAVSRIGLRNRVVAHFTPKIGFTSPIHKLHTARYILQIRHLKMK